MTIKPDFENLTFEEAIIKLEEIVKRLETGKSNLDETINNYEYALKLKEFCSKKLDDAKLRVKILANNDLQETEEYQ